MSGQWEVVSKKKDRSSKLPVPKINDKEVKSKSKKNVLNGVKIEEVLPKSQVQNLYSNNKSNKENKKPQEKNKSQDKGDKKLQKKEKPQEVPKPKPPKSIESALNLIDIDEFNSVFEESKNHYPDAPIVWLRELVQFLNQKVPIEVQDPVFSSKPKNYPLNVVPPGVKNIIEKSVKEAGKNNAQLYFDICLASMATDMGKGLPAVGYKFFLQYIATNEPKLVSANISKHITLRNSYQNRPNIGLSILWAVGHVGVNDLHSGLADLLNSFKVTNNELSLKKRKEDGLRDSMAAIKVRKKDIFYSSLEGTHKPN
ncbi:hypothetical protein NQ314_012813 [Rhamnusium bicolor]|uniref:Uncharacterized protein n=1 Tax=Rhamnusium bicolor TaxID=1586634 RepID=A0AAV8XA85_9CUCU|nr:hypothetical protein NQ314_012813 [Rhamnusium bicolor]